ncbi:hypothetical protein VTK73DRAFT_4726 [Phialemonium thermophilum]|uniref:Uncharacterized protein n=1 Tax=Phialemonium thermophilum TaxID=223376 RepID=A0ABR3V7A6_9PEZI
MHDMSCFRPPLIQRPSIIQCVGTSNTVGCVILFLSRPPLYQTSLSASSTSNPNHQLSLSPYVILYVTSSRTGLAFCHATCSRPASTPGRPLSSTTTPESPSSA